MTPTESSQNLTNDSTLTYKGTINIFSTNVETYNAEANTTSTVGPLGFDCYGLTTSPTEGNFTSQLTFAPVIALSQPSWLTFDTTTANFTAISPDTITSNTYTITSTHTGIFNSTITFSTIVNISIIEPLPDNTTTSNNSTTTNNNSTNTSNNSTQTNNSTTGNSKNKNTDKHCLNASSEVLCGVFKTLIITGAVVLVAIILFLIYIKLKSKPSVPKDMMSINQEQEPEENKENHQDNESVLFNQQDNPPDTESRWIHNIDDAHSNQI